MNHILGMFVSPNDEWEKIRLADSGMIGHLLKFIIPIALLPPFAWYYGSTQVGWELGDRVIKLTDESALQIMVLFYFAIVAGIVGLGFMVHWMAETYEVDNSSPAKGVGIAAYTCAPMLICGLLGLYPNLWIDLFFGCAAAGYTVYLLYIGVPIVMQIPKERGFLFASAMVAVGLVACAALLGATVILWEMGAMPVFTD
ncbi:MAG: hypothetical protein ACI9FB_001182 [Candidatus Azotimanducaceae bacterium]|jgi:hypothetical protein